MQKYRRNKKKKGDDVRLEIENIPIMKYGKIQTEIINILKKNGIENIDILQQKEGEKTIGFMIIQVEG